MIQTQNYLSSIILDIFNTKMHINHKEKILTVCVSLQTKHPYVLITLFLQLKQATGIANAVSIMN